MATKKATAEKSKKFDEPKKGDVFKVPFSQLRIVEGLNIRNDYGDIEGLAKSIEEIGVKVPFQGYREVATQLFFVVDGHRRYAACQLLHKRGIDVTVPFVMETKGTNEEMRVINMVATNDGKPLNPLELAEAVRRLLAYNWTEKEIASKIGKSPLYVSRLNLLNNAPKKFKNLVEKGKISPTLAIKIAGENEIEAFLVKFDAGEFNSTADEGGNKKITAKNLNKVDSWKFFKKFTANVDEAELSGHKKEHYNFMLDVLANKVSTKEFGEYFFKK